MDELTTQAEQTDRDLGEPVETDGLQHDDDTANGVNAYLARVSAWWIHVTGREGHEPMSYYDQ